MKKIATLTVEVLVEDGTSSEAEKGLQNTAWSLCEEAGRYLRAQLRLRANKFMDVKISVKEHYG